MNVEYRLQAAAALIFMQIAALAWWGWSRSGLAFQQLGLGVC